MEPPADAPPVVVDPSPGAPADTTVPGAEASAPDDGYEAVLAGAEQVLDEVDRALARLQDGTYGTCEACGAPIADHVLEADPTARHCETHGQEAHRQAEAH